MGKKRNNSTSTRKSRIGLFLLLAFGTSWSLIFGYAALVENATSTSRILVTVSAMLMPGIAAIVVQRVIHRRPLAEIGLVIRINRWLFVAAILPVFLVVLITATSTVMPGANLSSGLELARTVVEARLPPDQATEVMEKLESLGVLLPALIVLALSFVALIVGPTLNAVPALFEELGWRGLLQTELAPLGFWRSSFVVGGVWGLWHLPLVVNGHNYPGYPVQGSLMMILLCILWSPLFYVIRSNAGTVVAAAVMHGTLNALAGLPLIVIQGGHSLVTGVTGFAAVVILLVANLVTFCLMRRAAPPEPSADGESTLFAG